MVVTRVLDTMPQPQLATLAITRRQTESMSVVTKVAQKWMEMAFERHQLIDTAKNMDQLKQLNITEKNYENALQRARDSFEVFTLLSRYITKNECEKYYLCYNPKTMRVEGVASLCDLAKKKVYLDLLATKPSNATPLTNEKPLRGVGTTLLQRICMDIPARKTLALTALDSALGFYKHLGFKNHADGTTSLNPTQRKRFLSGASANTPLDTDPRATSFRIEGISSTQRQKMIRQTSSRRKEIEQFFDTEKLEKGELECTRIPDAHELEGLLTYGQALFIKKIFKGTKLAAFSESQRKIALQFALFDTLQQMVSWALFRQTVARSCDRPAADKSLAEISTKYGNVLDYFVKQRDLHHAASEKELTSAIEKIGKSKINKIVRKAKTKDAETKEKIRKLAVKIAVKPNIEARTHWANYQKSNRDYTVYHKILSDHELMPEKQSVVSQHIIDAFEAKLQVSNKITSIYQSYTEKFKQIAQDMTATFDKNREEISCLFASGESFDELTTLSAAIRARYDAQLQALHERTTQLTEEQDRALGTVQK